MNDGSIHPPARGTALAHSDVMPQMREAGAGPALRSRPAVRDARLLTFLDGWLAFRGERVMPKRSDIRPMDFPSLLPHIYLYRRDDDGASYRCVLAGEEIHFAWRTPIMGCDVRDMFPPAELQRILRRWGRALEEPAALYAFVRASDGGSAAERLLLPVSDADGSARFLFGITIYQRRQEQRPEDVAPPPEALFYALDSLDAGAGR